jgi:hypothetical protein
MPIGGKGSHTEKGEGKEREEQKGSKRGRK